MPKEMTPDTIRMAAEKFIEIVPEESYDSSFMDYSEYVERRMEFRQIFVMAIEYWHSQQPQQGMGWVIDEIERRQNLIASEPPGVVRETMIANLLVDLPSAEPEVRDGWVRVEDGLPEENGKYSIWDNGYDTALFMDGKWLSENKQVPGVLSDFRAQIFPSHWKRITPPQH